VCSVPESIRVAALFWVEAAVDNVDGPHVYIVKADLAEIGRWVSEMDD
jgi:hypothetical protein